MKIKYLIPSYHRSEGLTTPYYLSRAIVYVSAEDYPKYIKRHPSIKDRIVQVPDGVQGHGKARAMNWLLDNMWDKDTDGILIIDDDVKTLMKHVIKGDCKNVAVDEELFYTLAEDFTSLAFDWGCGMWSFGLNSDRFAYDMFNPFRTLAYLDGGCQGFCKKDDLRYDERLTVKEDVDMFLQQVQKHHKALRVDKYYLDKESFEGAGGSQEFRREGVEKEQFRLMQKKWGASVIRPNRPTGVKGSSIRSLGGAIKLSLPRRGV